MESLLSTLHLSPCLKSPTCSGKQKKSEVREHSGELWLNTSAQQLHGGLLHNVDRDSTSPTFLPQLQQ